jgi:hypothetical protein
MVNFKASAYNGEFTPKYSNGEFTAKYCIKWSIYGKILHKWSIYGRIEPKIFHKMVNFS